jgi:hypothetical protein
MRVSRCETGGGFRLDAIKVVQHTWLSCPAVASCACCLSICTAGDLQIMSNGLAPRYRELGQQWQFAVKLLIVQ